MAVLLNYKICDNAAACGGIEVCQTGAIFWDEAAGKIGIDNNLCISCKKCVSECPVGAIRVASTDEEYDNIKADIESDCHTAEELFVERYGAMPINEDLVVNEEQALMAVNSEPVVFVEQFQDSSIQCLLYSIPMSTILERYGGKYVKQQVDDAIKGSYPCLVIYQNQKKVGCVNGYYAKQDIAMFFDAIDEILKH